MNKLVFSIFFVLLVSCICLHEVKAGRGFTSYAVVDGHAKIDLQKVADKVTVRSLFVNGVPGQRFSYKLTVEKSGKSGTSNNAQSGYFEVKPDQNEVVLSTSGFNVQPQDKYFIQLQVYQGKELVSQDTLLYEPEEAESKN